MLELSNQGPWAAGLYPGFQLNQDFQWTCVIKASFSFDSSGKLTPLEDQPKIEETDQHYGKPLETSLEIANEIAPFKSGSEIYLSGTAISQVKDVRMMEVSLGIRFKDGEEWQKTMRIYGRRYWKGTRFTPLISSPEVIEELPLRYESAYGGVDVDNEQEEYSQNRVGKGFFKDPLKANGEQLPQIEVGPKFIKSPNTKAVPASFAPIPVFWSPRQEDGGMLNEEAVSAGLCPFTDELKPEFYNVAPPDQRFEKPFRGGEEIILTGLHQDIAPNEPLAITIPEISHEIWQVIGSEQKNYKSYIDTISINSDQRTISFIQRVAFPWSRVDRRQGWIVVRDADYVELNANLHAEEMA